MKLFTYLKGGGMWGKKTACATASRRKVPPPASAALPAYKAAFGQLEAVVQALQVSLSLKFDNLSLFYWLQELGKK